VKDDDEKEDRDLAQQVGALPRAIEPPRDLWAGVAARIEAKRKRAIVVRRTMTATSAFLAAAAVLLVMRTAHRPVATNHATPAPIASEPLPAKTVRAPLDLSGAAVVPEEESYDKALAALSPTVDERLRTLSSCDADAITESLGIIHHGIESTRAALEQDPDDADLRAALDDEYEQEIQTMNDVLDWTTRS
jgi:hypothetical protein